MAAIRLISFFMFAIPFFLLQSCDYSGDKREESFFTQTPEIREIRPQKPVKIKLKRSTKGNYSWDLSGDDADKIIEADKKLRGGLRK